MNVLYVFCDQPAEWNCSEWRCHIPSNGLNRTRDHAGRMVWIDDFANQHRNPFSWVRESCHWADVIFVQRNALWERVWDACDYWRGLGKIVVLDLDDDYPGLPVSNPAYGFWIENSQNLDPPPLERLREGLRHVDALTSPSKVILEDWKDVRPQGVWVPNLAEVDWWTSIRPREKDGRIVIGWGGSVSHYDSFWDSGVREALKLVTRRYPQVYFKLCGNDRRLRFKPPCPQEKLIVQPGVRPQDWPHVVATFDIGIAPLAGEYDRRRSWIKVMEFALAGIPCVFTDYEPYADLRDLGIPVGNTAEEWFEALSFLIENLDEEKQRAWEEHRPWALEHLCFLPRVDDYCASLGNVIAEAPYTVSGVERI